MLNYMFSSLNPMNMGKRIQYARKQAGLNQTEFGKKVGVSKGAVSQWENDDIKNLRMINLFAIEDATGFNARWIALGQGPERVEEKGLPPEDFDAVTKEFSDDELAALFRLAADQLSSQ